MHQVVEGREIIRKRRADRSDVQALAGICRQGRGTRICRLGQTHPCHITTAQEQVGPEHVRHGERRGLEDRLIELRFGTGAPAQVHIKRALEGVASERCRTADLVVSIVLHCHVRILTSW